MSRVGETNNRESLTHPDQLVGERLKVSSQDAVRTTMQNLPVTHWSFARNMEKVLPYAMEALSPKDSFCVVDIPNLQAIDPVRPKVSLSAGLKISLYQRMIIDNKVISVPVLAFNKYSHGTLIKGLKEVQLSTIMTDYKFWHEGARMKHGQMLDFQSLVELHILTFISDGYAIYNASSLTANQKDYYRINLVKDDILVECIVTVDDYFSHLGYSLEEKKVTYS